MQKSRNEDRCLENYITIFALNQKSSKAGTRKHGDKKAQVLLTEFIELEDKDAFMPVGSAKLTRQQKQKALRALSFLKEKGTTL